MKTQRNRPDELAALKLCLHYHLSLATDALQRIKQIRRARYKYALARSLALPGYPRGTPNPDRN